MSDDPPGFRNTCLLPFLLGPVLFGVLCIGASIVNYFHAKEVFILLFVAFVSLVVGFLASMFLYSLLSACWLGAYLEREVKSELHEKYEKTIIGFLIIFCSIVMFFGYFGEEVGKTWDNMDIGVRNDKWASTETPKAAPPKKNASQTESGLPVTQAECDATVRDTIEQAGHSERYSPQLPPPTRSVEDIASSFMEQYASTAKNIQQYSETQSHINCEPIGEWSMAPSRPSASVNQTVSFVPKNLSSQSAWQSNKSSDEEYWITEEDDETHNHTCSRYGEGDGTFSTEGSGNDCGECGGADYTSSSSFVSPTRTANTPAQTQTKEYNATRYWVTASSGKTHNASCRWYANSRGYYSTTGTGNNCKICGGAR